MAFPKSLISFSYLIFKIFTHKTSNKLSHSTLAMPRNCHANLIEEKCGRLGRYWTERCMTLLTKSVGLPRPKFKNLLGTTACYQVCNIEKTYPGKMSFFVFNAGSDFYWSGNWESRLEGGEGANEPQWTKA